MPRHSRRPFAIASSPWLSGLVFVLLFPSAVLPGVAPGDDALSQFVKSYGCGKTQALLMAPLSKAMAVWADNVVGVNNMTYADVSKDRVYAILSNGQVEQALNSLGDLLTFVAVADEVANGDAKLALKKASEWGIDYYAAMAAGPQGAAVWGTMKTLSTYAADLNKELLSLNLDTFANYVDRDPRLAGKNGGDIFLEEYLEWQSTEVHVAIGDNVRKQRNALIDYAHIILGQADFPRVLDWQQPKYRNPLRVAAQLMMKDASAIAEVKRQQRELQRQLPGLKEDLAIFEKFQYWYSLLKGVTCTDGLFNDTLIACIDGIKESLKRLPVAEGMPFVLAIDSTASLSQSLDDWDRQIDRLAGELEIHAVSIERLCRDQKDAWEGLSNRLDRFRSLAAQIDERALRMEQQKTRICASTPSGTDAQQLADLEADYQTLRRLSDEAQSLERSARKGEAPAEIDFSSFASRLSGWKQQAMQLKVEQVRSDDAFHKAEKIAGDVERLLKPCPAPAQLNEAAAQLDKQDLYFTRKHADVSARLKHLQENLNRYQTSPGNAVNDLVRRINEADSFLGERTAYQSQARRCLDEIPDIARLRQEGEFGIERVHNTLAQAGASLSAAQTCTAQAKRSSTDEGWSEGGYDTENRFDGMIEQIHASAQACDYQRALQLADAVLAQDPNNAWVNQNYAELQTWQARNERYHSALEEAVQHLQQGNADSTLAAIDLAMHNASTQCGQDRTLISLREQAQKLVELERQSVIEQAREESRIDTRQRSEARTRHQQREAERRRTEASMQTILTGIMGAIDLSNRRDAARSGGAHNDEDIVDHLVRENERKHGDQMRRWQESNNSSIQAPHSPVPGGMTPGGSTETAPTPGHPPPSREEPGGPLPPAAGGPLPPASGGYECSGPKDWCDDPGGWD